MRWNEEPVAIQDWGHDHWSTYGYVETRIVDHDGYVKAVHMRGHAPGWEKYPTVLRGGTELEGHNDFDCLTDAVAAGLLIGGRASRHLDGGRRIELTYWYSFTQLGLEVASALRVHKAEGGRWRTFQWRGKAVSQMELAYGREQYE